MTRRDGGDVARVWVLVLVCALGAGAALSVAGRMTVPVEPGASAVEAPLALRYAVSAKQGQADARYHFQAAPANAWTVETEGLRHRVTAEGWTVVEGTDDRWTLRLAAVGRGRAATTLPVVVPSRSAPNGLVAQRGVVTETWISGPIGVQQVWTFSERPAGRGALRLEFAEREDGSRVVDGGAAIAVGALRFGGVVAWDARGRQLSARFVRDSRGLALEVADADAVYPLTVDPLYVQQTVLVNPGAVSGYFGSAVALSGDGTVAVVGATSAATEGRAYVFTRSGSTWTSAATLDPSASQEGSDTTAADSFGKYVAISRDGSTILVGAYADKGAGNVTGRGSAYIFLKASGAGGEWSGTIAEAAKLTPTTSGANQWFGSAVSLSSDGATAVVGANMNDDSQKVFVYAKGAAWGSMTQTAILAGSDTAAGDGFGYSVAISGDGETIAVGAWKDFVTASAQGSVYVYAKPAGGTWADDSTQDAKLTASDPGVSDWLGSSVAISPGGQTILAGAPFWESAGTSTDVGAAYLWVRAGASWASATETARLTVDAGSDGTAIRVGHAVALSQDAATGDSSVAVVMVRAGTNSTHKLPKIMVFEKSAAWASAAAVPSSITVAEEMATGYSSGSVYDWGEAIAVSGSGSYALLGIANGDITGGTNWGFAITWTYQAASSDATLSALSLSSGSLSPSFSSGTTAYTASVSNATSSITVTPTRNESTATIQARVNGGSYASVTSGSASGALALNVGSNTVDVKVTAGDGSTTSTTTVTVTRQSTDATLSALSLSSGSLSPAFSSGTTAYTASVSNGTSSITVTPTRNESTATIQARVNGGSYASVTSGSASGSLSLAVGSNTVDVKVTAGDGSTTSTTTVTVTRAAADATLSALSLSSGSLSPSFSSGTTSYATSVSAATSSITVTPTRTEASATLQARVNGGSYASVTSGSASGALSLSVGSNTVEVKVTSGDGTTTATTTVTVTRLSNDATLSALALSEGSLNASFSSGTTSYTATGSAATSSITVTPTRSNGQASIEARVGGGSYASVTSGSPSAALAVSPGANTVQVRVTAGDGTQSTYTVTYTRNISSDATLSALALSSGTLSPVFVSGTTSYTASVANGTSSITVTPTPTDGQASIQVRANGGSYASVTSGSASESLSVSVGSNTVDVKVTAGDGSTTETTRVTVTVRRTVVSAAATSASTTSRAFYCLNGALLNLVRGQPDTDPRYKGATPAVAGAGGKPTCAAIAAAGSGSSGASGAPGAPGAVAAAGGSPVSLLLAPVVTKSVPSEGGSGRVAIVRHTVSLNADPAAVRLSFDGGASSQGWVETGTSFSVATERSIMWMQARDAAGATSAWTPVRLTPPRVIEVESKEAASGKSADAKSAVWVQTRSAAGATSAWTSLRSGARGMLGTASTKGSSGKRVQHRLVLSEDPVSARMSFASGQAPTPWLLSAGSVPLVTEQKVVWVQVRGADGLVAKWERVRLAPPATEVVTVVAGTVAKASLGSRHTVTLSQDIGSVRLSFDGAKTTRPWADLGKRFTVYTTLPAVWVQVRDSRDDAVSSWKRIPLPR